MNANFRRILTLLLLTVCLAACGDSDKTAAGTASQSAEVSGRIEAGLRVLTFDPATGTQDFRIYRGDYVRPEVTGSTGFTISIPGLDLERTYPLPAGEKPYIKFPSAGSFTYHIGEISGTIEAVEYIAASYREVSATEAAGLIANLNPLILDVRTSGEYAEGHLDGAKLLPVQEIQRRVGELANYKDQPVFIYCRSGNRSTVAAKVLIDAGFKQVINLRRGVKDWIRAGLPLIR